MVKTQVYFLLGILMIAGAFTLLNNDYTEQGSFNYCEDQPTFGVKYTNCDSIECINFYEEVKESVKLEHCGESN
jgi:hypothetical protein